MPIVMFDRVADDIPGDKIIIDDVTAASEATDFLMRKAKKNVGILSTVDYVNVGRLRTQGYSEALMKRGVEVNQDLILKIEDIDHCDELIEKFIDNNPSLDGIVAVNELFAVTASKILLRKGKRIPDDVAIVAFTDGMLYKYSNPSLTTIGQNGYEMGGIAAAKLIDRLEQDQKDEERYETVIVKTSLIERESTP